MLPIPALQRHPPLRETTESTRMSRYIMVFTVATVLYPPPIFTAVGAATFMSGTNFIWNILVSSTAIDRKWVVFSLPVPTHVMVGDSGRYYKVVKRDIQIFPVNCSSYMDVA